MPPAVVADDECGHALFGLQAVGVGPVALGAQSPRILGLTQAVQEDHQPRAGAGQRRGQRAGLQHELPAVVQDGCLSGEWAAGPLQQIPEGAVERADRDPGAGQVRERGVGVGAGQPVGVDGAADQASASVRAPV